MDHIERLSAVIIIKLYKFTYNVNDMRYTGSDGDDDIIIIIIIIRSRMLRSI